MGFFFKRQKIITIINAFLKKIYESIRKPNKSWVDKGTNFCN